MTGVMSQVMGQVSCKEIELKDGIRVRGKGNWSRVRVRN